jgi:hypothetical protein
MSHKRQREDDDYPVNDHGLPWWHDEEQWSEAIDRKFSTIRYLKSLNDNSKWTV